jgi:hypothetical protein
MTGRKSRKAATATETIKIAGVDTIVERLNVPLDLVDLDPENPRIGMAVDARPAGSIPSQKDIEFYIRLKSPEAFDKLKVAIEANQGIFNPIWARRASRGRFQAVEGNTRVLVYRDLHKKILNDTKYVTIPARILPPGVGREHINFVRVEAHLRGVTPWDAYERARYLWRLNEDGYSVSRLAGLTRLREGEILNGIAAYKTMTEQYLPKYPDPEEVLRFSYFVEYHTKRKIREAVARSGYTVADLCDWIGTGKIPRAVDIRDLPDILSIPEARTEFETKGYRDAMDVVGYIRPTSASPLYSAIGKVIDGLAEISLEEVTEMRTPQGEKKLVLLRRLDEKTQHVLQAVRRMKTTASRRSPKGRRRHAK